MEYKCTLKGCEDVFMREEDYRFHRLQHFNEGKDFCTTCQIWRVNLRQHYQSIQHKGKYFFLAFYLMLERLEALQILKEKETSSMDVVFNESFSPDMEGSLSSRVKLTNKLIQQQRTFLKKLQLKFLLTIQILPIIQGSVANSVI